MFNFSISIISVNYRNPILLIESIRKSINILNKFDELNYEFVIVDNFSNDDSEEIIRKFCKSYKNIRLVLSNKNGGFGYGCNLGALNSKYDTLWMLNSDAWIEELNSLKKLYELINNKQIGLIGTSVLLENNVPTPQGGGECSFNYLLLSSFRLGYIFRHLPENIRILLIKVLKNFNSNYFIALKHHENNKPYYSNSIGGCSFLLRKNLYKKINGFDEKFFLYDEDGDLSKRIQDLGFKNILFPQIVVKTINSSTTSKLNSIKLKLIKRKSRIRLIKKHFTFIKKLILILVTEITWIFL